MYPNGATTAISGQEPDIKIAALGALTLRGQHGPLLVRAPKQRSLLGLLAVQPNQPVHHHEIAEALWGPRPPSSAQDLLYTYMHRLRRVLEAGEGAELIASTGSGYLLHATANQLDVLRFSELSERAGRADDPSVAAGLFDRALGCWRGPALGDLPESVRSHPAVATLGRRRLQAALARADLADVLGDYHRVVPMLRDLAAAEPLNEGLTARLIICLAGSGQPAAALALFGEIRDRLRDELGVEPDRELRDAQLRVLRQRVVPGRLRTQPAAPQLLSFTLPRPIDDFTGRTDEVAWLTDGAQLTNQAPAVQAIDGMAGVGKTTLAIHLAHRLTSRYPDAQLFVDLHGTQSPMPPLEALRRLLSALGIDGVQSAHDLPSCVDLWRRWTVGHRALVVLDDAESAEQVRPLLPAGGCYTIVTSRTRLTSLEASRQLSLDVLPLDEAYDLVGRILGERRSVGHRDSVEEVVRLCGYLPLAVRIAASRLRDRPAWSASHLAARLRDEGSGLGELRAGDRSVEAAFGLSYRQLSDAQQRLFRLLGVFPGTDIDAYAAAALAGWSPVAAEEVLEQLVDVHLLEQPRQGRYRFHALIRRHARRTAVIADPDDVRSAAQRRAVDFYLRAADLAATLVDPGRRRFGCDDISDLAELPVMLDAANATTWLEAERANLTAAIGLAADQGWHAAAWRLAQCLWRHFLTRGHLLDWLETHEKALVSAQALDDPLAEAETLKNLGVAYLRLGRFTEGMAVHERALAMDKESRDIVGEAKTHNNLGFLHFGAHSYAKALGHHRRSARLYRAVHDPSGEGRALVGLGNAFHGSGRYVDALEQFRAATALTQAAADGWGETLAYVGTGFTLLRTGQPAEARHHLRGAHDLARAREDRGGEALALVGLGLAELQTGHEEEAWRTLQAGLSLADEAGEVWGAEMARSAMDTITAPKPADH